jgi:hypothetical protein
MRAEIAMDLATQQRALFRLVHSETPDAAGDDPYLLEVAASAHLGVLREIIAAWRAFDVERSCPLTAALLHERGFFEATLRQFAGRSISPFIEGFSQAVLEGLEEHEDPLVVSVARFERALHRVKLGDSGEFTVEWEQDPRPVLDALMTSQAVPREPAPLRYQTRISHRYPNFIHLVEPSSDSSAT